MAGGNKANSPKTKKRNIQDRARAIKAAAEKKRSYTRWHGSQQEK